MGADPQQLHVALFPFMAPGHKIPIHHAARLFAARNNVRATIITTSFNVPTFAKTNQDDSSIDIEVFRFPTKEAGLPEGCEDVEQALSLGIMQRFLQATEMFTEQLELYLNKTRPSCLVADMFFSWATELGAKFNIPVLIFHTSTFFTLCAGEVDRQCQSSTNNVLSDNDEFVLPSLPHKVKMMRSQFPKDHVEDAEYKKRLKRVQELDHKSYGVIVNSFYELEPEYVDFFRNKLGRKAWHIGPVSLSNRSKLEDKASIDEDHHECLKWLNSKRAGSVIYICFGSSKILRPPQMLEIAIALEDSGQEFIWVVDDSEYSWLPGFELRMEGKGLVVRGWAPQVPILEHEAMGAFVTHCGSNSILEAISAGVPMVTWPLYATQFFDEKLVTEILKIGVPIGANKYWDRVASVEDIVKKDAIVKALEEIMTGNEAEERRSRARKMKEMAGKAVKEGGSSHSDITSLIDELRAYHA